MKTSKCLMGVLLSAVLLFGSVFAAEALTRDGKEKGYNPIVQDRDHCLDGQVDDCADDDCCPESWIGDGFEDCEDQAYGCDLTCYDNDGGDCVDPFCGDGACNGSETEADCPEDCTPSEGCADCEFDWSPYGSECCDTAWDEFGIDCATLEGTYSWDCAGCNCPGDIPAVCGDGACTGGETYETCPEDCDQPSGCADVGGNDSWIGDGWCDSINNNGDCNFDGGDCCPCTCYDNVDAGCPEAGGCYAGEGIYDYCGTCDLCYADGDSSVTCPDECAPAVCGDGACTSGEDCNSCPEDCGECGDCDAGYVPDCADDDCCPEAWIGDGLCDGEDQAWGCDLTCYDWDGGDCAEPCDNYTCWDGSCVEDMADCPDEPVVPEPTGVCIAGADYNGYAAVTVSWDIETACGDGLCNGDEDYYNCPDDCNAPGTCNDGEVVDCDGSGECWPESWIGDGFADCQDQAYGADLTCYDCDGGDCPDSDPGCGGTAECGDGYCNGDETEASCPEDCASSGSCDDCEFDWTAYGSECCDTAWGEFGINCADLEANYYWDCSGCSCPGDSGGTTGGTTGGDCDAGYVPDCADDDCCPESWIGDGFEDCEDQAYGCDLTCYDNDGGDCDGGTTGGTTGGTEACTECEFDFTPYGSECCDTAWDDFGIDCMTLEANYNWDCSGCNCPGDGPAVCGDGNCTGDETYDNCPDDCLPPGECPDGQIVDCDGTNECWPESWIGDGFADCQDQAYGADLTCYDCDGGDCPDSDPGCTSCADQGLVDCPDGSCAATTDDCPETECPAGTIADCSGDGDCGFETWLGDGYCDGSAQLYGIDNCCYDNDGGDCTDEECAGGRAQVASEFKKGYELTALYQGRLVDMIKAKKQSAISLRDGVVVGGGQAVRVGEEINSSTRALMATVALSCDACLDGSPWSGEWIVAAMDFGYFTVYGFDPGADVCGTVTFCEDTNGACSDTSEQVCAVSGDADSVDCVEGGTDCPSDAGSGDVNGDGDSNVLDIVTIVNVILGGEFVDECAAAAADVNGDGQANVLDIVQIVNGILGGGRVDDASSAKLIKSDGAVILEANGYIGGVQMTLSHDGDFSIDLTDKAMVAEYNTVGNETILVIVAPEGEELFTYSGDFEIVDMIIANSQNRVNVGAPTEFNLSTAYPNPFNPTTSLELSVPVNGQVTVQVYNLMGQVVATLANGYMDASTYTLTWDASNVSSGMYIVKAEAAGTVSTQKLMLMK